MTYNLFQLNKKGIAPLLEGIENIQEWNEKKERIRSIWLDYIGGDPVRVPVRYEVLSEHREDDHVRYKLIYDSAYDDKITAFLLVPLSALETQALPHAAVLALHPTNENGKEDIALASGRQDRRYALELVEQGFVVLVPDAMTAGERIFEGCRAFDSEPFYERHPEWTTVGKNIADHRQGIDLLTTLPYVDAQRIGAIGHSFGGYNAYFLATIDHRLKAVVSSCGFSCFAGDEQPMHWGVRDWYTHLPKITTDLSQGRVPFDFHEIIALIAPIPFFNYSAQNDMIFPHWKSIGDCMHDLYLFYEWLDQGDRFQSYLGAKDHDFPIEMRQLAYQFLERWLRS